MTRFLTASIGIAIALALGYVVAAAMATEVGRSWLAALACAIMLAAVVQSFQVFGSSNDRLSH